MDTSAKISAVQPTPESSQYPSNPDATPAQDPQAAAPSPILPADITDPADYRLIIDRDPLSGAFVYRTIDRSSGATVAEFPSEELVRLRDSADYMAGTVFNGKV